MAKDAGSIYINIFAKTQRLVKEMNKANRSIKSFDRSVKGMLPNVLSLQTAIAGFAVGTGLKSLWDTQVMVDQLNRSFAAITGSSYGAGQELEYVRSVADRLGQEYYSLTESMKYVAAAARDTTLEGKGVRDIFLAVTEASTALGLTNVQTKMSLYAISQMISKGTVNAEELRQQLGERLPGAYQAMARALDVTTAKLSEMLEQGQVVATEAIPKLAKELSRMYADAAMLARNAPIGMLNRFKTAWIDLKNEMGSGQFLTTASSTLAKFTALLKDYDFQQSLVSLVEQMSQIADIAIDNAVPAIDGFTSALSRLAEVLGNEVIMEMAKLAAAFYMFGSKGAIAYGAYKAFDYLQNFNEKTAPKNRLEELKEEEKYLKKQTELYERANKWALLGRGTEERRQRLKDSQEQLATVREQIKALEDYNKASATPAYDPRGRHDPAVWAADAAVAREKLKKQTKVEELSRAERKALEKQKRWREKIRKEIEAQEQEVYDMEYREREKLFNDAKNKIADLKQEEADAIAKINGMQGGVPFNMPVSNQTVEEAKQNLANLKDSTKESFNWMIKASEETARAMQSSFSDFFYDAFKNNLDNLSDLFSSFLDSLLRSFSSIMGQMMTQQLFGANFLSGTGSIGGLFGRMFSFNHGGYIGENVVGVGTSSGKSYEFHNDEFVFNRKQLRNAGGGDVKVVVNEAANSPEQGVTVQENNTDGVRELVVNLVAQEMRKPSSPIGQVVQNTYGVSRTLRSS